MSQQFDLVAFIKELFGNHELQNYFAKDPQGALEEYGLTDVSAADIKEALSVVGAGKGMGEAPAVGQHESPVSYIDRVITHNKYIDDRDVTIDKSIHQNIDTHGGKLVQSFDDHSVMAIGDGSIAAGGNIEDSKLVTGDNNMVGDGNVKGNGNILGDDNDAIQGNGNTGGFGEGAVSNADIDGSLTVEDGGAFGNGGSAAVDNRDNSTTDSHNSHTKTELDNVGNTDTDNSQHGSHNSESETTSETVHTMEDSHNTSESHHTSESESILDSFNIHL